MLAYCMATFQNSATAKPVSSIRILYLVALLATALTSTAAPPMPQSTDHSAVPAAHLKELQQRFGPSPDGQVIIVDVSDQQLTLYRDGRRVAQWPVSTSQFGTGNRANSQQTPLGVHRVARMIGADAPVGTLFRARRDTGRTVEILKDDRAADGDYVTTRILWLEGLEPGVNKGAGVDSFKRYIYIHGTAEEGRIGRPFSHGCVRMRNDAVVKLFDQVKQGTLVEIRP